MLEIARELGRVAKKAAILPSWVQTLGAILDEGFGEDGRTRVTILVSCTLCRCHREIDIVALAARVGREYSLVNRRCRCRMKPGCPGWNRFYYGTRQGSWTRHLIDPYAPPSWY